MKIYKKTITKDTSKAFFKLYKCIHTGRPKNSLWISLYPQRVKYETT